MTDMTKEIWKDVKGFEGLYKVSNYGNVYSVRAKRNLAPRPCGTKGNPHYKVHLCNKRQHEEALIHRLVAEAFLDLDRYNKAEVINHLDQNPANNRVDNLEITTARGNALYSQHLHPDRIMSAQTVKLYDKGMNLIKQFDSVRACATYFDCSPAAISLLKKNYKYPIIKKNYFLVFGDDSTPKQFPYPSRAIKVTNLETGEVAVYNSQIDACEAIGIGVNTLVRWLDSSRIRSNKSKTSKYKFEHYWAES